MADICKTSYVLDRETEKKAVETRTHPIFRRLSVSTVEECAIETARPRRSDVRLHMHNGNVFANPIRSSQFKAANVYDQGFCNQPT